MRVDMSEANHIQHYLLKLMFLCSNNKPFIEGGGEMNGLVLSSNWLVIVERNACIKYKYFYDFFQDT